MRQSLQRAYYDQSNDNPPGFIVGSWGKGTAIRPPTDVDIFFELPVEVYHRINSNSGNVQSQLLQEVRNHLLRTYPQTTMRGDGQVVTVGFNSIAVEVVWPAAGSVDTELRCLMELEVSNAETEVQPRVQA